MVATPQWLPTAPMGGEGVEASEARDGAGFCRSCCSVMSERPSAALLTFTFAKWSVGEGDGSGASRGSIITLSSWL